jgi:hypothetical protein
MKKEDYSVTFAYPGCESRTMPLVCKLDGWYIGNILVGGLLGMLIVDPASGAMYKFDETYIDVSLREKGTVAELQILNINDVPEDAKLTPIN